MKQSYYAFSTRSVYLSIVFVVLIVIPFQSVFATSGIANRVAAFCAPMPTVPDVNSCSSCHMTTNNRGANDLTAAGMWSLNRQDINFCPSATPAPTPTPTPVPTPSPGMGRGMSSGGSATGSMGRGSGGDSDDDDDMEDEVDDDDDMPPPAVAPAS